MKDRSIPKRWARFEEFRTSASIRDPVARWLWRYLQRIQPETIMEFGAGFSTLVIASYAARRLEQVGRGVLFISLEHDAGWYEVQARRLKQLNLSSSVKLVHPPLVQQDGLACYDLAKTLLPASQTSSFFDLVLVDGPVGSRFGGPGRRGSLTQAVGLAKPGGLILLHDALRDEEYLMVRELTKAHEPKVECLGIVPDADGLAVLKKLG